MQTTLLLLALLSSSVPRADVEAPEPEEKAPVSRTFKPNREQKRRMMKRGRAV